MTSIKDFFQPEMRRFHGTAQDREVQTFGQAKRVFPPISTEPKSRTFMQPWPGSALE